MKLLWTQAGSRCWQIDKGKEIVFEGQTGNVNIITSVGSESELDHNFC